MGNKTESASAHQDLKISTTKLATDGSTSTSRKVLNTYGRSVKKARIKGLGKLAGLIDAVGETPDLADEVSNWEIDAVSEVSNLVDEVSNWAIDAVGEMPNLADEVSNWEINAVGEIPD